MLGQPAGATHSHNLSQTPNSNRISACLGAALALIVLAALIAAPSAIAGTYGGTPLNISIGIGKTAPNGASGEPAVSGDNRKVKLIAYSSFASNLVSGDSNGVRDVFVWHRPGGSVPRQLGRGYLERVSVTSGRAQANGESSDPSVDGSMVNRPHCVAFQSTATNLAKKDALPDSDIYVRDLRRNRTVLVSNGLSSQATNVDLAGNCKKVVFEAAGKVWWSRVGAGKPKALGRGHSPDYSRDGKSITYVGGGGRVVFRHGGFKAVLSTGTSPHVSDYATGHGWAVAYNSDGNVKLGLINRGRKSVQTAVENAIVGGITSKAAGRGIVVWARQSALFYLNRNTGNSDDLAYARRPITEIDSSARANLIAFAAPGSSGWLDVDGNTQQSVFVKWLPK